MNKITLSNLDKIFWPEEHYTKKDLIDYYLAISKYILPHLRGRPESLNRFPDGIKGEHFYHKNSSSLNLPDWIETKLINETNYIVCENVETLIYMVNLGCIEINPWNSRLDNLDNPDYMVLDLDPINISFSEVVETSLEIKKLLDEINLSGYPKTSGASGMHIYIKVGAKYNYEQIKSLAKILVTIINKRIPKITTIERITSKRGSAVYLDYLQNNPGQTLASVYSVRPVEGALVSTPLEWGEVNEKLSPELFNIKNVPDRLLEKGDLFSPLFKSGEFNLEDVLAKIQKIIF